MIDGVIVTPLKKIADERGTIMPMMRSDSLVFKKFGEIYFSTAYPGVIKAWHIHSKMSLNYAVVYGMIKLVLYDDRKNSKTRGELMEFFIGDDNYCLVTIPPKIWNGFKCIGKKIAIVANCSDIPHEKEEISRINPSKNNLIKYNWEIKFR